MTHVHLFLWVFIHLCFYSPINPAEKLNICLILLVCTQHVAVLKWFIVYVNNPKLARCVFKSHFSVCLVFPVTISCCSDLIFLQRIMNVSSPSVYFSLSLCLANKALQIQPNSPTFPRRKCCERLHRLLLYSVNKIQPAATSGIFRSFRIHPTSTAAPRAAADEGKPTAGTKLSPFWQIILITAAAAAQNTLLRSDYLLMWSSWTPHTHSHMSDVNNGRSVTATTNERPPWAVTVTPGIGKLSLPRG